MSDKKFEDFEDGDLADESLPIHHPLFDIIHSDSTLTIPSGRNINKLIGDLDQNGSNHPGRRAHKAAYQSLQNMIGESTPDNFEGSRIHLG